MELVLKAKGTRGQQLSPGPGRGKKGKTGGVSKTPPVSQVPTLAEQGVNKNLAKRARKAAALAPLRRHRDLAFTIERAPEETEVGARSASSGISRLATSRSRSGSRSVRLPCCGGPSNCPIRASIWRWAHSVGRCSSGLLYSRIMGVLVRHLSHFLVVPQFEIVPHLPIRREPSYWDHGQPPSQATARPEPARQVEASESEPGKRGRYKKVA